MSTFYIIRDEDDLTHHGIKGQKWGVRRYQNPDGSYTSEGLKRRSQKRDINYKEESNKIRKQFSQARVKDQTTGEKRYADAKSNYKQAKKEQAKTLNNALSKSGIHVTKKGWEDEEKRWQEVGKTAKKVESSKKQLKKEKSNLIKERTNTYKKIKTEEEELRRQSDELWADVKKQYKSLGNTPLSRFIEAARQSTPAGKKYVETYNKANDLDELIYLKSVQSREAYKKTGLNFVSRFYNNKNIVGEQPDWKPPRGEISEKPDFTGDDLIKQTKKRRGY